MKTKLKLWALALVLCSAGLAGCGECKPAAYVITTKSGAIYHGVTMRSGALDQKTVAFRYNGKAYYIPREEISIAHE